MRRRSTAGGEPVKARGRKTVTRKRRPALKAARRRSSSAAGLSEQIALLKSERDEALEQQTATADVLRVISTSPGELTPVFHAMLENATRLCEAYFGILYRFADGAFRAVALRGAPPEFAEFQQKGPIHPIPASGLGRIVRARCPVHIIDSMAEQRYVDGDPYAVTAVKLSGSRTLAFVPMLKDDELIGAITIYRKEVRPFTDKQIELLSNFANQAVIAIENTRLLNELRQRTADLTESLEQQTATSEVLSAISSSPGELEPVFNAMLENAVRLCGAKTGNLFLYDGEAFHAAALHRASQAYTEARRQPILARDLHPEVPLVRITRTKEVIHIADVRTEQSYIEHDPEFSKLVDVAGGRTLLLVPLLKENELVGTFAIYRQEVRPFTDKQIELVRSFAAQAVIAIENTRLLSELRQSLEQQTATSDILRVISQSPTDAQPVFDNIVVTAARLLRSDMVMLLLRDGAAFSGVAGATPEGPLAGALPANMPIDPSANFPSRAILDKKMLHLPDWSLIELPEHEQKIREMFGVNSALFLPLLREGECIGLLTLIGKRPNMFGEAEIAQAESFRDQALIAIENTRLFNELRQSLQQQTATADVLKIVSRSTFDLQAVLETLTESAARLCEAEMATIARQKGDAYYYATTCGFPKEVNEYLRGVPLTPGRGSTIGRCIVEGKTVQIPDVLADPEYMMLEMQQKAGFRTVLGVPLLREGRPIGVIGLLRSEVRPFTDKQIELVTTFADQAVIAIENVRLFEAEQQRTRELSESLEQQTATSEVLRVISASPGDLAPVFEAMLANAVRICDANFGTLYRFDGKMYRMEASVGTPPEFDEFQRRRGPFEPTPGIILDQVMRTKQLSHCADMAAEPVNAATVRLGGARSIVGVPMLKDDVLIGAIVIYRKEVRPFTDKQIALVTNFAAQAVIAIENTRLLNELRQRTDDLTETLEQQTATAEILTVISKSLSDTQPVFDAIVQSGVRLFPGAAIFIALADAGEVRAAAIAEADPARAEAWRQRFPFPLTRAYIHSTAMLDRTMLDIPDVANAPDEMAAGKQNFLASGYRAVTIMPMMRGDAALGALSVVRREPGRLSDKQIAVLNTFAAQAVIAIENTRLLNELRESLQQQTATAEVLSVISSSPGDVEPVFQAMLENATRICEAKFGTLFRFDGKVFYPAAQVGTPPELFEFYRQRGPFLPEPHTQLDRVMRTKQVNHTADYAAEAVPGTAARLGGARSTVAVPMLRDDELMGAIVIYRQEVRPFSDKQIALVQNFANQAVIAIENTRLLSELREALEQQKAIGEILRVIANSPNDVQPVLNSVAEHAARICEAQFVDVFLLEVNALRDAAWFGELARVPTLPLDRSIVASRSVLDLKPIHVGDLLNAGEEFAAGREYARKLGHRTILCIPLIREGRALGTIMVRRTEVRPFEEKHIALLTTFADQAAIAIENVRLFEAEQQRTRELAASLEDLRTAQDRLVQTEKLASLGQLTAGIAHEIKNPLNFVNNFSAVSVELIDELTELLDGVRVDDKSRAEMTELMDTLRGNLDKVVQHGQRADSIVKNMLLHSRQGSGERRPVDINALVEESLNLAYHGARAEKQGFNIALERSFDPAAGVADLFPQEITRVLLNLISNGFYAATRRKAEADGGDYEPTLIAATRSLGDSVEIRIRDNGTGIPPEVKEKLFNPFFTTKPAGEGTGLGLSISHDIIVKQHSGSIEVDTQPGGFTEFRIVLPRAAATVAKSGEKT